MGIVGWANNGIKKLDYYDMQLIKISVIGFTLMIAKLWEPILSLEWYWYMIIFIVAAVKPILRVVR